MTDPTQPLSDEEVRQVARLMETLENSPFDFLQVEVGGMKVTLGKGEPPPEGAPPPAQAPAPASPSAPAPAPEPQPAAPPTAAETPAPAEEGTVAIVSPMLGRYYAQSEPGAPPFVKVGDAVKEDTTVALIEVMKMFTSVTAGVQGVVTEVCVANEEFVESDQVLYRVKPG